MNSWLFNKLHISWLVAVWCLGLTIGVISIHYIPRSFAANPLFLLVGLIIFVIVAIWRWRFFVILAIISGVLIGLWRGEIGRKGVEIYDALIGKVAIIQGQVLDDPDLDKNSQTVLRLGNLQMNNEKLPGQIWVTTPDKNSIKRSDIVRVKGKMTAGFGAFSASIYRAKIISAERPVPGDVAVGVRDWFAGRLRTYVPESESALGLCRLN